MVLDLEKPLPQAPSPSKAIHAHRLDHNPSKLPAHRFIPQEKRRLQIAINVSSPPLILSPEIHQVNATQSDELALPHNINVTTPALSPSSPTGQQSPVSSGSLVSTPQTATYFSLPEPQHSATTPKERPRRPPASLSSQGIQTLTGPPPALSTQRSSASESPRSTNVLTTTRAPTAQKLESESSKESPKTANPPTPTHPRGASKSLDERVLRPKIPPIRSFRSSSTRASLGLSPSYEMNGSRFHQFESSDNQEMDRDLTLRALEGFLDDEQTTRMTVEQNQTQEMEENRTRNVEAVNANEDLFLNLARDDLSSQANHGDRMNLERTERRRSRIALANNRQSLPSGDTIFQQSPVQTMPRRGSDLAPINTPTRIEHTTLQAERAAYQPFSRDRTAQSSLGEIPKSRYAPVTSRSSPITPRSTTGQELTFQSPYSGRRPSVPDSNSALPARTHSYRQSNLSFSAPRTYNSSPLVAKNIDFNDGEETPRVAEGTESTASTTAPSTVWDELDDLKSRIRKLELTGKLPLTSGAAISHASGERPPTATTTNTTMSTSPLRGHGLTTSTEPNETGPPFVGESHPLLHSALAKLKQLVSPEVYKALEASCSDAQSIASMMSSVGQPGPMSSAQSVIASGGATATDRQLRRKADSMCRSLTELCLALSDAPQPPVSQALIRPGSRDKETPNGAAPSTARIPTGAGDSLSRVKSSPRALTRLEARRSSLLATSLVPSPRYNPTESTTPTQGGNMEGRRTSLLFRHRRAGTEDLDDDEAQFRAPSRATTEIGRPRNVTREFTSQHPLPDRAPSVVSNLPMRRQYISSGSGLSPSATMPNMTSRRYLDRSTPERDSSSVVSRIAEDRGQRSLAYDGRGIGRSGSLLDRRSRQQNITDSSTATQSGAYRQ